MKYRMPGMVELNASCLVLTVAAVLVPIEAIEECRGHLGWLGRDSRSEGTDETALGGDESGSQLAENARKSPLRLWVPATTEAGLSPSSRWFLPSSFSMWTCLNCETQVLILSSAPREPPQSRGEGESRIVHCQKHFRQEMKSFVGGLKIQWELIYV